jgi:hypothetical protein
MADLSVTIGLDQTELEKGLANAGKSIGKMGGQGGANTNPFQGAANQLGNAQGIGTLLGGPIGGLIGGFLDAFGSMISAVMAKVKELADYAQKIRLTSLTTGLGIDQIRQLEAVGQAFGVSLDTITRSVVEFTRRMGEARIKGGEVPNLLAKMGVGMDEIAKGSFDATAAMKALADSYAAGTDEATLLYYGTKLFGDSFKELLPIIKAGSKAIDEAAGTYYKALPEATSALGRFATDLADWGRTIGNVLISLFGSVVAEVEKAMNDISNIFSAGFWNPFESSENKAKRVIENAPKHMTNDEIIEFVLKQNYKESEREDARKELEKQLKGPGKKLSPFGLSDAGAASNLQSMGGGDIFGAVAFTPLERIATATEKTAQNTDPNKDTSPLRPADTPAR